MKRGQEENSDGTFARIAREKVLLSTSFAPVSHTCCRRAYAFPGNLNIVFAFSVTTLPPQNKVLGKRWYKSIKYSAIFCLTKLPRHWPTSLLDIPGLKWNGWWHKYIFLSTNDSTDFLKLHGKERQLLSTAKEWCRCFPKTWRIGLYVFPNRHAVNQR